MSVLAQPDVRRLWIGETTSAVGTAVSSVAMPLVAFKVLDAEVFAVTLLTAATWLPWLLVGLPAGAWVDRLPKRPVLITADVVSVALLLSVPCAAAAGVLTMIQLLAVSLGLGTCAVLFRTAWTAYVPVVVPRGDLVRANALLYGSESAAQIGGPGAAGLLVGAVGAVGALVADAASFAVSAVLLLRVRAAEHRIRVPRRRLRTEVAEGVGVVARDRLLRTLVVHGAASNLPLVGYGALIVPFLVQDLGQAPLAIGLLLAVSSLGGVVGAAVSSRVVAALGSARALVALKAGAAPCALLLPLAQDDWRLAFFVVGTALVDGGVVGGNVISASFRQAYVAPGLQGRVGAASQVVNLGTIPLGAVLAGVLATALGTRTAMTLLAGGFALAGLVLVIGLRGIRELPVRHDVDEAGEHLSPGNALSSAGADIV